MRWFVVPILATAIAVLSSGCSTVHGVRPIGSGAVQIDASLGGPITELFGAPVPLPITTVGATVGVSDKTNVHAAVHPTPIALFGFFAADVGVSTQLLAPKGARPRLMADLTVIGAGGDRAPDSDNGGAEGGVRFFARPTVTASWDWGKDARHALYASLGGFVQPYPGLYGLGTVAVGNQWGVGRRVHLTTQVEWIAPYASNTALTPHYYAPGDLGAISLQLGLGVRAKVAK
ncbi:MAG: hypothetical protein Q8P41_10340 [Pseudomonadota bacterium]|nr:hypothetical protein [Pseudomonadota bacterium]